MATQSTEALKDDESQEDLGEKTDNTDDDKDDEYLKMLESFSRRAHQNGGELIPEGSRFFRIRRTLINVLQSFWCNIIIIALATVDAIVLVCVLLLEIEALKMGSGNKQKTIQEARFGLECVSISIIILFMIEISLKLFALGPKHFCSHPIEVVDAVVTVISLVVDALMIADHVAHFVTHDQTYSGVIDAFGSAAGLLIVFRMWRIIRILNATLVTMSTGLSRKLRKMKANMTSYQLRIFQLERRLQKHQIPLPNGLEELNMDN
ncbi:Voltage-gated hydrogen channel 1 [Fasciola gigantica]|uniref:Voltage-gated hydrogen channel 1 n=1 Tax=Fasciola gigantica TaxID=46835 RepID=A0A504Z1R4_FASGI|nr:Voltage-gated hydrogen channel 1 [Fasciola gigantica]